MAPRSLAPVSEKCCKKPDTSIPSDIGRHRGADCTAEPCRHSWGARKARCSCTRARRTVPIHPCRPCRLPLRRVRRSLRIHRVRPRRRRRHLGRPSPLCRRDRRCLRCRTRRPIQTRPLRHPAEDTRCRDSRRHSRCRCPARNLDTRPDSARSRRCRPLRRCPPAAPAAPPPPPPSTTSGSPPAPPAFDPPPPSGPGLAVEPHAPTASNNRRARPHRMIARTRRSIMHAIPAPGPNFPGLTRSDRPIRAGLSRYLKKLTSSRRADPPSPRHSLPDDSSRRVAHGRRCWSRSCVRNSDRAPRICVNVCIYSSD